MQHDIYTTVLVHTELNPLIPGVMISWHAILIQNALVLMLRQQSPSLKEKLTNQFIADILT